MKLLLCLCLALFLGGCGTPITFSGSFITEKGQHYDASIGFTLPTRQGLSKDTHPQPKATP